MANKVLVHELAEPLGSAKTAKIDVDCGVGHLAVSRLAGNEQLLAKGTLQHLVKQDVPSRTVNMSGGQSNLTLRAGEAKHSGFHFPPWAGCGGAYEWQMQLNPVVPSDVSVQSRGGNVNMDLAGMAITRLSAASGGGNLALVLPDNATDLSVTAKTGGGRINVQVGTAIKGNNSITANSGAGSVVVSLPSGVAANINVTTGMGKVIVDPRFTKIDKNTYRSPDYDTAVVRIEVTARSGAGNVTVT